MLPQEPLIARVVELCAADPGLDAALMYGSFAQGSADEWSDIEFWLSTCGPWTRSRTLSGTCSGWPGWPSIGPITG
jgi:predicted nucleotidyltransferase